LKGRGIRGFKSLLRLPFFPPPKRPPGTFLRLHTRAEVQKVYCIDFSPCGHGVDKIAKNGSVLLTQARNTRFIQVKGEVPAIPGVLELASSLPTRLPLF
jgi:hypothetical protein